MNPIAGTASPMKPALIAMFFASFLAGCHTTPPGARLADREPLRALDRPIDLERFMGDWHVIAHIPTFMSAPAATHLPPFNCALVRVVTRVAGKRTSPTTCWPP